MTNKLELEIFMKVAYQAGPTESFKIIEARAEPTPIYYASENILVIFNNHPTVSGFHHVI